MGKPHILAESNAGKVGGRDAAVDHWQLVRVAGEPGFCSAYNESRGCFLGVEVEVADFSPASLEARLPALTPQSGNALWIVPFRGISPANIQVPLDLLYLNEQNVVLDVVEFFPIGRVSPSSRPAVSVLALPADSLASIEVQPGDRLIICAPEEMKRRLRTLPQAAVKSAQNQRLLQENQPGGGALIAATDSAIPSLEPLAAAQVTQVEQKKKEPGANWFQRLFKRGPRELRGAEREPIPGIVAYFFTGGAPAPHGIRDISCSGIYIFTEERWYLGTIVRLTITDRRNSSAVHSITVNAKVVRWGNDGAGLEFVLMEGNRRSRRPDSSDESAGAVSRAVLASFLQRVKVTRA